MGKLEKNDPRRAGAEIAYGEEECQHYTKLMLEELGFPPGVIPIKNFLECGRVRETGFVWMKLKEPYEHEFKAINAIVKYSKVVTAYVEKNKMKKMTGVKCRELLIWIPLVEMSINEPEGKHIYFKTNLGIGENQPLSAFLDEETPAAPPATAVQAA
uniref:DUF538 family protein n=1 Tax=Wolffia arrhiza TaxID=161111 RepID=D2XQY4_WOLAR|nr:hypothetical protein [Wolffia arrhiza]